MATAWAFQSTIVPLESIPTNASSAVSSISRDLFSLDSSSRACAEKRLSASDVRQECRAHNRGVTGNVGVGTGVALTTPGSITQIQVATTIVVSASVNQLARFGWKADYREEFFEGVSATGGGAVVSVSLG